MFHTGNGAWCGSTQRLVSNILHRHTRGVHSFRYPEVRDGKELFPRRIGLINRGARKNYVLYLFVVGIRFFDIHLVFVVERITAPNNVRSGTGGTRRARAAVYARAFVRFDA